MRTRIVFMKLHRWSGLYLAAFLTVAGLTGAVIAWHDELEAALTPHLVLSTTSGDVLSPFELARIAERVQPYGRVDVVFLDRKEGASERIRLAPRTDPQTGLPYDLDFDQVFLDPATGNIQGTRYWGEVRFDIDHLIPMVYRLHYSLLSGGWGEWLLGIAALIWTLNCFIGLYLTLPGRKRNFLRAWKRAWLVRPTLSPWQLSVDMHRAAGLWMWAMLLVFALSALQFNLNEAVFRPVLKAVLPFHDIMEQAPVLSEPPRQPQLNWEEAHARGTALMARHVAQDGFSIMEEAYLFLDRARNAYTYAVRSSLDVRDKQGETRVVFSASDGRELGFVHPHVASGNLVSSWLSALHLGWVWGRPYQVLVALTGVVVAALSVTGVLVWLKRRS